MRESGIDTILTDSLDEDFATYKDRFSLEGDEHGPLRFLGWPRCFADSGKPSRFLVFCRVKP